MDTKGKVYMIFFQDDTRILRRVMYEKRPVIENKLLSGRQVLASEPTPSDTSDSDSEYHDIMTLMSILTLMRFWRHTRLSNPT